jgi:hypothetical protein
MLTLEYVNNRYPQISRAIGALYLVDREEEEENGQHYEPQPASPRHTLAISSDRLRKYLTQRERLADPSTEQHEQQVNQHLEELYRLIEWLDSHHHVLDWPGQGYAPRLSDPSQFALKKKHSANGKGHADPYEPKLDGDYQERVAYAQQAWPSYLQGIFPKSDVREAKLRSVGLFTPGMEERSRYNRSLQSKTAKMKAAKEARVDVSLASIHRSSKSAS